MKRFGLMFAFASPGAFLSGWFDGRVVWVGNIGVRGDMELPAFVAVCLLVAGRP